MGDMIAGPVSVKCQLCGEWIVTPSRVMPTTSMHEVLVAMDPTPARDHLANCKATPMPGKAMVPAVPAQRYTFKDVAPAFIAAGPRWCLGCKTPAAECLRKLHTNVAGNPQHESRGACCGMCAEGDTHPVAAARAQCAEWAVQHGAQD